MVMDHHQLLVEASDFIRSSYAELDIGQEAAEARIAEIAMSISRTGSYAHTTEELAFGAKLAWRNSSRCIGRLFWTSLEVFDRRGLNGEEEIADAVFRHMEFATNQGRIRPAITIFASDVENGEIRIWNHQLIRYAGYEKDGIIVGDPASLAFTRQCQRLGWQGSGTAYDILPLVIQVGERSPWWFEIPPSCILEVPLTHPDLVRFAELGLKWYAVPFISDMRLDIGGLHYTAAPFNGWYMETEIGARNLADAGRYNMLPLVASLMNLDTSRNSSLWKDRALVELNAAVLHSFKSHGVSMVDHHTAAEQFLRFEKQERQCGREVSGTWSWLIPPVSPATTNIWHHEYRELDSATNYRYRLAPY
jgi:nitric-oxide synthase, bacterial